MYFRVCKRVSFSYFPKVALIIQLKLYSWSMQHLRWSSLWQKMGKNWKLLLTVVTKSFILNMAGLLDPILAHIDKFRLQQWSVPCGIHMFKLSKEETKHTQTHTHTHTHTHSLTRNMSNIFKVNNKDTRTTPVTSIVNFEHISHFILLLLLLNSNKQLGLRSYSFRQ